MFLRRVAVVLVFVLLAGPSAAARDRPIELERANHTKMRALNVGITAFFTVFSAMRQKQVDGWRDVARYLLVGGGAGASYYEAKRLAGNGKTTAGWLLANATTSVVENVTSGEHPVGQLGYTIGPMRFRVATRYARNEAATIEADVSAAELLFLGVALDHGESVSFRNGVITVDRDDPWHSDGRRPWGHAVGIFPGVIPEAPPSTWHHEMVHAIQFHQIDGVEPPLVTLRRPVADGDGRPLFALRHVRAGFTHLLNVPQDGRDYADRWFEVEAYWLAEETPVQQ